MKNKNACDYFSLTREDLKKEKEKLISKIIEDCQPNNGLSKAMIGKKWENEKDKLNDEKLDEVQSEVIVGEQPLETIEKYTTSWENGYNTGQYAQKQKDISEFYKDWRWIFNIVMEKHDKILPTEDIEKLHKLDKKWKKEKPSKSCKTCLYEHNSKTDNTCATCIPDSETHSRWTPKEKPFISCHDCTKYGLICIQAFDNNNACKHHNPRPRCSICNSLLLIDQKINYSKYIYCPKCKTYIDDEN